jgi:hypothetical protein
VDASVLRTSAPLNGALAIKITTAPELSLAAMKMPKLIARGALTMLLAGPYAAEVNAQCDCQKVSTAYQVRRAKYIFTATISAGYLKTISKATYYRKPNSFVWVQDGALSESEQRIAERKVFKNYEVWAEFSDVHFYKGAGEAINTMFMGNSVCSMTVTIGDTYLIYSADGKSTSECQDSVDLSKLNMSEREDMIKRIEDLVANPRK